MPLKNVLTLRRVIWGGVTLVILAGIAGGCMAVDRSLRHDGPVKGDVLVSNHGRTLTASLAWSGGCEDKPHIEASESGHTVTLVVKRKWSHWQSSHAGCDGNDPQAGLASTSLAKPLGDRKIIDAVTSHTINPFDDTHFPYPRYLPPGYTLENSSYCPSGSTGSIFRNATPKWDCSYHSGRRDRNGQAGTVDIATVTGETGPKEGKPMTVNGHPGRIQVSDSERTAAWTQNGYTITVQAEDQSMTDAEFLRITQSLRN
ncbi:hypothetical protein ACIQB5_48725 [Streptomyces sp. NPDC088560]|uniref:hypothetical protein n=1 Tax=Streptomyces sp. NPDC088560 TaxID=3365868 RepID=UPI00381AB6D8